MRSVILKQSEMNFIKTYCLNVFKHFMYTFKLRNVWKIIGLISVTVFFTIILNGNSIYWKKYHKCTQDNLVCNFTVIRDDISLVVLEEQLPEILPGGIYSPQQCIPIDSIAVIIPVRNRERHLRIWLRNMHPFLMRQQVNYRVYVIEQSQVGLFNRAKLFNIGFVKAAKDGYNCFIFHDVDTLPDCDYNYYVCEDQPTHLSGAIEKAPDEVYFSGVIAVTKEQHITANGYSNKYYGWGGEDDDFGYRVVSSGMKINRRPANISRFSSLDHKSNIQPTISKRK